MIRFPGNPLVKIGDVQNDKLVIFDLKMGFFVVGIYIELIHDLIEFRRNAKALNIIQPATTAGAHRFADLCVLVDNDGRDVIGQSGGN
ncbi:hypothetical protein N9755_01250 [bacterium]|nr:hypothetical protein [Ascidiaceihabitans sp.]MDB4185839.1 hypothetical protein [bacterium]